MKSGVPVPVARLLVVSLLAAAIMLLGQGPAAAQFRGRDDDDPEAPRHGWLASLSAGKERARTEGKPLMVVIRCLP
jgi:hypothetical protein